jgi:hypothetical protein
VQAVLAEAKRLLGTRRPAGAAPGPDPVRLLPLEAFRHVVAEEVDRARRGGRPTALLVVRAAVEGGPRDAELALTLQGSLRQTDVLSREAGEYLALLVDTPERGALVVAERLRARLSAIGLDGAVGLACLPNAALDSASQLLAAARAALEAEPGRSPP